MTGIEIFLEILHAAGVRYLFGNPGTTELPLNDALAKDRRFQYVFGLHEIPVMAAADGYALASRQPAVVNVHISCGLGNAMGMLYNAHCAGTPLVLTAGQQDRRMLLEEPVLISDLARVAETFPAVTRVVPMREIYEEVRHGDRAMNPRVMATLPVWREVTNRIVAEGRFLTDIDLQRVAKSWFPPDRKNVGVLIPRQP